MGIQLKVDPGQLMNQSNMMDECAETYKASCNKLNEACNAAYGAWKGGDSEAFYQKVAALQDDFDNMYRLLKGAAVDMRESAIQYSDAQDNSRAEAGGLAASFG